MKYFTSQKELIDLIAANDQGAKCYFEEKNGNSEDYIYVRRLNDLNYYADGRKYMTINRIEIVIYSKSVLKRTKLCSYINKNFNLNFSFSREGDMYTASATLNMMVKDWNDQ